MINCPYCGAGNRDEAKVCRMCETALAGPGDATDARAATSGSVAPVEASANRNPVKEATEPVATQEFACPNCQTMNDAGWAFCQQCGNRLSQQPPAPQSEPPSSSQQPFENLSQPPPWPQHPSAPQNQPPSTPQGFKTVPTERPLVEKSLKTVVAERIPTSPVTMPEPPPNPLPPSPAPPNPMPPSNMMPPGSMPTVVAEPPLHALSKERNIPSSLQTMANEPPIVPEQKPAVPPPGYRPPPRTEQVESYQSQSRADGAICPKCNHPNQAGSAFCAACGNTLTVAQTIVMTSPYAAAAKGKLHLVMEGGQAGETYELGEETVIGRASGDMIFPHDGFMSGRHARIVRRGANFVLVDEGSRNGTFIRIKGEVELKSGDMILIGKQLFRFEQ